MADQEQIFYYKIFQNGVIAPLFKNFEPCWNGDKAIPEDFYNPYGKTEGGTEMPNFQKAYDADKNFATLVNTDGLLKMNDKDITGYSLGTAPKAGDEHMILRQDFTKTSSNLDAYGYTIYQDGDIIYVTKVKWGNPGEVTPDYCNVKYNRLYFSDEAIQARLTTANIKCSVLPTRLGIIVVAQGGGGGSIAWWDPKRDGYKTGDYSTAGGGGGGAAVLAGVINLKQTSKNNRIVIVNANCGGTGGTNGDINSVTYDNSPHGNNPGDAGSATYIHYIFKSNNEVVLNPLAIVGGGGGGGHGSTGIAGAGGVCILRGDDNWPYKSISPSSAALNSFWVIKCIAGKNGASGSPGSVSEALVSNISFITDKSPEGLLTTKINNGASAASSGDSHGIHAVAGGNSFGHGSDPGNSIDPGIGGGGAVAHESGDALVRRGGNASFMLYY